MPERAEVVDLSQYVMQPLDRDARQVLHDRATEMFGEDHMRASAAVIHMLMAVQDADTWVGIGAEPVIQSNVERVLMGIGWRAGLDTDLEVQRVEAELVNAGFASRRGNS